MGETLSFGDVNSYQDADGTYETPNVAGFSEEASSAAGSSLQDEDDANSQRFWNTRVTPEV